MLLSASDLSIFQQIGNTLTCSHIDPALSRAIQHRLQCQHCSGFIIIIIIIIIILIHTYVYVSITIYMVNNSNNIKTSLTILIQSFQDANPSNPELHHQFYNNLKLHCSSLEHHISFHSTDTVRKLNLSGRFAYVNLIKLTCG